MVGIPICIHQHDKLILSIASSIGEWLSLASYVATRRLVSELASVAGLLGTCTALGNTILH